MVETKIINQSINKLVNILLAFGLSLISIGLFLHNSIKSFEGIGALIVLIAESYYFFKIIFNGRKSL
ncbi:MAG TPA: hypothetical protein VGB37_14535 [Candidatus Lokiarchaeia archaeon]